ncbi:hypothetical protein JCM19231_3735 [Vibrio ishigakensis]|uniref:Uncharacterized protein n=2 Tax=Vibrio ishigakensis TaxID=1481914 RepID=A0A0B8NQQ0_9VIBR|nr:hypothetical protein JCM19231_3735 [Vibrio ishigakensis]
MKKLGLLDEEPEVESEPQPKQKPAAAKSEADLLSEFEDLDLSDFKG